MKTMKLEKNLLGSVNIGKNCFIGNRSIIKNCLIGNNVFIGDNVII